MSRPVRMMHCSLLVYFIALVSSRTVYIGSLQTGIWVYSQNDDGTLNYVSNPVSTSSGFLAIHRSNLYATGDNDTYVAYKIQDRGQLNRLNSLPGHDGKECWTTYVSVHPSGKYIFGANYLDGSFVSFSLNDDGSLIKNIYTDIPGVGSHGDKTDQHRQDGPHAHMMVTSPDPNYIIGCDLGADRVWIWAFDPVNGNFSLNESMAFHTPLGSGPRHIVFHPNARWAYLIDEIACTILVLEWNNHQFDMIQLISTLQSDQQGNPDISAAEIRIHPTGNFLYVTNRNGPSNNIGAFSIDSNSGKINPINWWWSGAVSPRGMNIDPSGRFLYVANEQADGNNNNLFAFSLDASSGELSQIGSYSTGGSGSDVEFGQ